MKLLFGLLLCTYFLFANENLRSIYDHILLKNAQAALSTSTELKKHIEASDQKESKHLFSDLVTTWKEVEAFYILGDLNDDYLDTPRYIDIFHQGNEDIHAQLDLILSGKEDLKFALYKNSHKTINALEYVLFAKDLTDPRVQTAASMIISAIQSNLEEIYRGYGEEEQTFLKDEVTSNAIMLNALIESSYKLKEWRVGDPAGLSRKFRGKPDNSRAEYALSKNSLPAIKAIIATHQMVLAKQTYTNFGSMIHAYGVNEALDTALKYLDLSMKNAKRIQNENFGEAKPLYESLKQLHTAYFITLIGKLKITAKILDADGD